jgi:MYXO-CTERM domain-containing protein
MDQNKETSMRRKLTTAVLASALLVAPAATAFATTPPSDPNDVGAVDNPVDENDDDDGFDDWGLFGLLGLAGLAGLAGRKRRDHDRSSFDERGSSDLSAR